MQIAGELDHRLESCGLDGLLLEFIYSINPDDVLGLEGHLAQILRTDINDIEKRINYALRYISGWHSKQRSYRQFKAHKKGR